RERQAAEDERYRRVVLDPFDALRRTDELVPGHDIPAAGNGDDKAEENDDARGPRQRAHPVKAVNHMRERSNVDATLPILPHADGRPRAGGRRADEKPRPETLRSSKPQS